MKFNKTLLLTACLSLGLTACTKSKNTENASDKQSATQDISVSLDSKSESNVSGTVEFLAAENGGVRVKADIKGLEPNTVHGFHIHEKPDCSAEDAKSAGGHFNPKDVKHGGPNMDVHHVGDMGNITSDAQGNVNVDKMFSQLSLDPANKAYIVNRAVVIHGGEDDLESQPSGAAGPRVACGSIVL